jgi:putative membrane protein
VGVAVAAFLLHHYTHWQGLALNFAVVGVVGSALAIFIAFRNNSAYARWMEARAAWGSLSASVRVLARLVVTFTDSHSHQPNYDRARSEAFKREMVLRLVAWVHALRLSLRQQDDWGHLAPYLPPAELAQVAAAPNKPLAIQLLMAQHIYQAMADGRLGGFDSFQMEGQLLAMANAQATCERIKHTPMLRQYDFFTRVFVLLFATLLPFGLLGYFQQTPHLAWLAVPLSVVVASVFIIMDRAGAANEHPFENRTTDVPLTALSIEMERDALSLLGETQLPPAPQPIGGYLF